MPPRSTAAAASPVLKLSTSDDVLTAVPYLLGFHPRRSLVVIGLSGPRSRVGVTMRIDLADMPPGEMARRAVNALRQDGDDQAVVLVYDPEQETAGSGGGVPRPGAGLVPGEQVVAALRSALRRARISLRDALRVSDGRWWSYLCHDPACCPPDGSPMKSVDEPGGPSLVAATAVSAGMTALPDRAALRAGLEPPAPWVRAATGQAMDRVADEMVRMVAGAPDGTPADVVDGLLADLRGYVGRFSGRRPVLSDEEVARTALAMGLIEVRDMVITWTLDDDADALQQLLVEVVRRVEPADAVPATTVLAWCAYLRGQGALAAVALELVAEAEPDYSLTQLLTTMLENGIHPH